MVTPCLGTVPMGRALDTMTMAKMSIYNGQGVVARGCGVEEGFEHEGLVSTQAGLLGAGCMHTG